MAQKKRTDCFRCTNTDITRCVIGLIGDLECDMCDEYGKCKNCARQNTETCNKCAYSDDGLYEKE